MRTRNNRNFSFFFRLLRRINEKTMFSLSTEIVCLKMTSNLVYKDEFFCQWSQWFIIDTVYNFKWNMHHRLMLLWLWWWLSLHQSLNTFRYSVILLKCRNDWMPQDFKTNLFVKCVKCSLHVDYKSKISFQYSGAIVSFRNLNEVYEIRIISVYENVT